MKNFLNDMVLREYDLPADKVYPLDNGFKIETRQGPRFLKVAKVNPEALVLAEAALEWLINRGFTQVVPIIRSKYRDPFVQVNDQLYYLTGWIKGKALQLGRKSHLQEAIFTLAKMHAAAKGFQTPVTTSQEKWGQWPDGLSRRLLDIEISLKIAESRSHPSEFDLLFRSGALEVIEQIQNAIVLLINSPYLEMVEQAQKTGTICHGDYGGRNLIRTRKAEVYLTNFDNCCLDICMFDLGQLLNRVLPGYGWDLDLALSLLNLYETEVPLAPGEAGVLLAILSFPQRFWQIACQYYLKSEEGHLEDYHRSLEQIYLELPLQQDFIWQFAQYFNLSSVIFPGFLRTPESVL